MEKKQVKTDKFFEELSLNAQKGETYILKLRNNPKSFITIPMIRPGSDDGSKDNFTFQVLEPEIDKGIYRAPLSELEVLMKK